MKYQTARPLIKSGDMLAWSHRGIKSWHDFKIWLVRMFTRSEYSHVGIAWVVGGRVLVIEAVMPLVRVFPLSKLLSNGAYWVPMGASWSEETEEYAMQALGDPYSQWEAIVAPFEQPPENKMWECAELVARTMHIDGINLGTVYTPSALVQSALENHSTLHYIDHE